MIPVYPIGGQKTAVTAEIEYIKGAEYFIGDDPGEKDALGSHMRYSREKDTGPR